ncbi:hypothetical protein AB1Y20_002029 [Prymnesium parvum]|uniref:Uncharacterized protein n=1 Tax=Prymnesium parvum TaxID=97485 RepID=A0AB34JA16_PRYPA
MVEAGADPSNATTEKTLGITAAELRDAKSLNLREKDLRPEDAIALAAKLLESTNLTEIDLARNYICAPKPPPPVDFKIQWKRKGRVDIPEVEPRVEPFSASFVGEGVAALIDAFSKLGGLTSLDLSSNGISSLKAVDAIGRLPSGLRSLNLANNQMNANSAAVLTEALAKMPKLSALDLSENNLCTSGLAVNEWASDSHAVIKLAAALPSTSLASLKLAGNHIGKHGQSGILALADAFSKMPSLTEVDLADNYIGRQGPEDVTALFDAFTQLPKLRVLSLASNQLCAVNHFGDGEWSDAAVAALCARLPRTALTHLDLGYNSLSGASAHRPRRERTGAAVRALCEAIGATQLEELSLHGNEIDEVALDAIRAARAGVRLLVDDDAYSAVA